jgi:hypothetical protein
MIIDLFMHIKPPAEDIYGMAKKKDQAAIFFHDIGCC